MRLGLRDEERFASLDADERDFLLFQIDFCFKILTRRPSHIEALQVAADALTALGYYHDGLRLDRRLAALLPDDPTVAYNLACSLALTQHIDEAFDVLERALALGYADLSHLRRDPDLAAIRDDPRFARLLVSASAQIRGESRSASP